MAAARTRVESASRRRWRSERSRRARGRALAARTRDVQGDTADRVAVADHAWIQRHSPPALVRRAARLAAQRNLRGAGRAAAVGNTPGAGHRSVAAYARAPRRRLADR